MQADLAKWIAILCDHGKRNGIEHYIKLLVWGGWKSNSLMGLPDGKEDERVVKFVCADVDKSGKDARGAADAIKKSIEAFECAGLVGKHAVEKEHLCTDSGGGAGLSNLEPKLKENGTMPEHGRGSNCQYHGQNKPYENASTAAFGSQGLEKANVFQAGYQYSVLIKALKEDVGLEVSFA